MSVKAPPSTQKGDQLQEIHDFKTFGAQDHDPSFQEQQIIRIRGQEEVLKTNGLAPQRTEGGNVV